MTFLAVNVIAWAMILTLARLDTARSRLSSLPAFSFPLKADHEEIRYAYIPAY
jgi:hypothetical protein